MRLRIGPLVGGISPVLYQLENMATLSRYFDTLPSHNKGSVEYMHHLRCEPDFKSVYIKQLDYNT